jgi:Uma2 family endonuclease
MAEPAWKMPHGESGEPDEDSSGRVLLQRWVEHPNGRMELLERPLTPEEFLDPQFGDQWMQARPHGTTRFYFFDILYRHLETGEENVMVVEDMKHLFGPGLPGPAPDLSVIRGARDPAPDLESFDAVEQGVVPCLVLEIVSPTDARIRKTDEVDKVLLYARVGIPEYLLVDPPRKGTGHRFRIRGLRLDAGGRYQPIAPDEEGFILSETTGLRFRASPEGKRIEIFDARTGERLLSAREEVEARKAAERARKAAEKELQRLRAEIERLKTSGR